MSKTIKLNVKLRTALLQMQSPRFEMAQGPGGWVTLPGAGERGRHVPVELPDTLPQVGAVGRNG